MAGRIGRLSRETADLPLGIPVFGFSCRLAELSADLRGGAGRETTPARIQGESGELHRDFGKLREVLQDADASVIEALVELVLSRFNESPDYRPSHQNLVDPCSKIVGCTCWLSV